MKDTDKVIVIKYKPTHTETEMSFKDFKKKYKDNVDNAVAQWLITNEEQLPVSVIKDTQEETYKAMLKYFNKDFIRNFNENAYTSSIIQKSEEYTLKGAKGLVDVMCYKYPEYKQELKTLEFVHIYTK